MAPAIRFFYSRTRRVVASAGFIIASTTLSGYPIVDGFIDAGAGYDVTLALLNSFFLNTGESIIYITQTAFGSGAPAVVVGDGRTVPEPGILALLSLGLLSLGFARRRNRNR